MSQSSCRVIDSGIGTAEENMTLDREFLRGLREKQELIIHHYDWKKPSLTYGKFIDPYALLSREKIARRGIDLAERPTGGGIIFHFSDFAYSIIVPQIHPRFSVNTLQNYILIHECISEGVRKFLGGTETVDLLSRPIESSCPNGEFFCMAKPTQYDVLVNGKKIGGGAQRRTRFGFLHQGTIALGFPQEPYRSIFPGESQEILDTMKKESFFLLGESYRPFELEDARKELKRLLTEAIYQLS